MIYAIRLTRALPGALAGSVGRYSYIAAASPVVEGAHVVSKVPLQGCLLVLQLSPGCLESSRF